MKYIKYSSFFILTAISLHLSVNMFYSLGADTFSSIILSFVAFGLEVAKVFALLRIEYIIYLFHQDKKATMLGYTRKAAPSVIIYTLLATLSIVASLGFALETVDRQVEVSRAAFVDTAEDYSFEIKQKEESLEIINDQMAALREQMRNINPDYATGSVRLSTESQLLANRREALIADISELRNAQRTSSRDTLQSTTVNTYGMFTLMGGIIGITEKVVMTILLSLASILIEASIVYTSPTIVVKDTEKHEVVKKPEKKKPGPKPKPKQPKAPPPKPAPKKIPVKSKTSSIDLLMQTHSPAVKVTVGRKRIDKSKSYKNIIQVKQGAELKDIATIAQDTGLNVDEVSEVLHRLSKTKHSHVSPLVYQKNAKWYLGFTKDYVASIAEKLGDKLNG